MNNNLESISSVVQRVDIVDYISKLLQLKKVGSNHMACCPFHSESTPSFSVSPKKQKATCFGAGCFGGDVLDFIMAYHRVNKIEAMNILREYDGSATYSSSPKDYQAPKADAPKDEKAIQLKLNKTALALMHNHNKITIFKYIAVQENNKKYIMVQIHQAYQKLFEKTQFIISDELKKRTDYILKYILAYDTFFRCPAIIIRNHDGVVCDVAKYRALKPDSFDNWGDPKYMYTKEEDKLKDRGKKFLYPFSKEMDRLINKSPFFFIGEGLKNALVAFLFGVPFISIESAGNTIDEELKKYILEKAKTKTILWAFDGDEKLEENGTYTKGHGAWLKAKKALELEFPNIFEFDSNVDFAEYLKDENSLIDFDKKFNSLFIDKLSLEQPQNKDKA